MEDRTNSPSKERVINFALLMRLILHPDGNTEINVRSENQGIPDSEVILTVEAWLEKVKERAKRERMGGFSFSNDGSSNDK